MIVFFVRGRVFVYIIKIKLNLKKGFCHALHLDVLFQTKKKFKYIDRAWTEKSWNENQKIINREKTKNIFRFFQNKHIFQEEVNGSHGNFSPKTRCRRKTNVVFERAEDGLSSHAFISISNVFTKYRLF